MHDSAVAGACAGLVSSILTCPLDVVKTRLQAQGGPEFQPGTALSQGFKGSAGGISGGVGGGLNQLLYPASSGAVVGATGGISVHGGKSRHTGIGIEWPLSEADREERRRIIQLQRREAQAKSTRGLRATVRRIWEQDGVRGFYRGLGPTIFGYLPTWAIYFTVYDAAKEQLITDPGAGAEINFLSHILSAMAAGAASTFCTSPLWVVKTRFMLQSVRDPSTRPYRHTGDAFIQIYKLEGMRGFYKGLLPSLFGVSHVAVQFPLYETFKKWAREYQAEHGGDAKELSPSSILVCSATSKMIASVTTYPHEVLRTRLQMLPRVSIAESGVNPSSSRRGLHTLAAPRHTTPIATSFSARQWFGTWSRTRRRPHAQHHFFGSASALAAVDQQVATARSVAGGEKQLTGRSYHAAQHRPRHTGVIEMCRQIAREEGIRGFYKGMAVNLMRTLPSSAMTILTYELIMQSLRKRPPHEEED